MLVEATVLIYPQFFTSLIYSLFSIHPTTSGIISSI